MFFEVVGVVLLGVGCGDFIGRMLGEDEIEMDGNWKLWCMSDDLVFVILCCLGFRRGSFTSFCFGAKRHYCYRFFF